MTFALPLRDRLNWLYAEEIRAISAFVLLCSVVAAFSAVVLTNSVAAPGIVLHWLVLPSLMLTLAAHSGGRTVRSGVADFTRWIGASITVRIAIAYLTVLALSTLMSEQLTRSSLSLLQTFYFVPALELVCFLVAVSALVIIDRRHLTWLLIAFALAMTINALINTGLFLGQLIEGPAKASLGQYRLDARFGTPLYVNATHLAPLFAMFGLAAFAIVGTWRHAPISRAIVASCAIFLAIGVLMTQARGAIGALIVGALVVAFALRGRWRWIMAGGIAVVIVLALAPQAARQALLERADSFRLELWGDYLKLAQQRFWTGFGLNRALVVTITDNAFEQPHNALIWAQLRGGIAALGLAIAMMISALYWSVRYWRATGNVALLVIMIVLGITSVTEIGFLVTPPNWLWIMFWLPIGLAAGAELTLRYRLSEDGTLVKI